MFFLLSCFNLDDEDDGIEDNDDMKAENNLLYYLLKASE